MGQRHIVIIIPKWLNLYAKKACPTWQEWYKRRLRLLLFAGPRFVNQLEDQALLAGVYGPNIMRSVSAFPYGTAAAAGVGGSTLALTTLLSSQLEASGPVSAGIRFLRGGDVQELTNNDPTVWTTQNTATEWILAAEETSTIGDDHHAKLDENLGTQIIFSTGWSENTYAIIDQTLTATLVQIGTGEKSANGTAYVREIANTSNEVSASVSLSAEVLGGGGIFL